MVPFRPYPARNRKFKKNCKKIQKIAKKFKKIKKHNYHFKPKTGWDRPRMRENKNYRSDQFLPDP